MTDDKAISNGPNARPRDANIGTTGGGLPNDSSTPVEISSEEEARIAESLLRQPSGPDMPYDVSHAEGASQGRPLVTRDGDGELHEDAAAGESTSANEAMDAAFKQGEQELGGRLGDRRGSPD
jgi:hypothetical protein